MAVNAKNLPTIFNASTWTSNHIWYGGMDQWMASVDGDWITTHENDRFRVVEADFNAIKGATVSDSGAGPYLVIGGVTREVRGFLDGGGVRWLQITAPEE